MLQNERLHYMYNVHRVYMQIKIVKNLLISIGLLLSSSEFVSLLISNY